MDERIKGLLDEALQHCETGDHAGAERLCREVLILDRDIPDAWNILAQLFYQRGRFAEAKEAAERATTLRPEIPPYWLTRGNIETALNELKAAQLSLGRAVELNPTFAEAHYRLGMSLFLDNRTSDAVAALRAAARYAPNVAEIHYQLAHALNVEGRWEHAMRAFQDAFARDPGGELDRRPCLDFMRHLHWNALPEFWDGEITRFFRRNDVDKAHYVSVGLRMLKVRDAFRRALAAPRQFGAAAAEIMGNDLFRLLLQDTILPDPEFESMLTVLRAQLLFKQELRAQAPIEFLCALAQQCFNNDFVYAESESERASVESLAGEVKAAAENALPVAESLLRSTLVLAMYRPLDSGDTADRLAAATVHPDALKQWFQRCVTDVRAEHELRAQWSALVAVADSRSANDEASPHPRWYGFDRSPPVRFDEWLERELPTPGEERESNEHPQILIAGCSTGQNAISLAATIAGAEVIAIDGCPAKVAYATRTATQLGVGNIEFRCAGFPDLLAAGHRYDAILSEGALHHTSDPEAALRGLVSLLRPRGWLKIALHSERGRTSVNEARRLVRERHLDASPQAIREFRQHIVALGKRAALTPVTWFHEFYSLAGCRDLLFSQREQQYRLPQVAELLHKAGLELIGLANVPPPARAAYGRGHPEDPTAANLANWDAFEAEHPETFMGMFHVWARAR